MNKIRFYNFNIYLFYNTKLYKHIDIILSSILFFIDNNFILFLEIGYAIKFYFCKMYKILI